MGVFGSSQKEKREVAAPVAGSMLGCLGQIPSQDA